MTAPNLYFLVTRTEIPELNLPAGTRLVLYRFNPAPLMVNGVAINPTDYQTVLLVALHARRIEAEHLDMHYGAMRVVQNLWSRWVGLRTANHRTLKGSAAAVRAALKRLADPLAVLPVGPAGAELRRLRGAS